MRFKVLEGVHQSGNGKLHKKGDIVESATRLDKTFRGKFALVQGLDEEEGGASHPVSPFGNDVTVIVDPRAKQAGLIIYHRVGWYTVTDIDGNVLTEPKLRRDVLTPWIDEYLENVEAKSDTVEE